MEKDSILQKMHEYEVKVMTALGFKSDDPVVLDTLDKELGTVSYKWYGPGDPPPPRRGFMAMEQSSDSAPRYSVHWAYLPPGVWDAILRARKEWESNFPRGGQ